MIKTGPNYSECLYLDKDNEIYVNNCQNLKQHQIDGLRFLYRQFKKNKLGAVLNFPPGSGKSVTVVLFLQAAAAVLKERVLILCADDEEIEHWQELLLGWTEYKTDEIAIESSNPRVKKKIFIKNARDLTSYVRCNWSVVIIKDENMSKSLHKVKLEADLKILITSTDLKKDLSLLYLIHNWMFPKSKNIKDIIINEVQPKDKLLQNIILDTFLEDFVLRKNKVKAISETKNTKILQEYKDNKTATTRKNKDATGTKIKRSKRTIDDVITTAEITNDIPTDHLNISDKVKEEPEPDLGHSASTDMKINRTVLYDDVLVNTQGKNYNLNVPLQIKETQTKIEVTEATLDFREAIDDIVNENMPVICVEESTESLDFDEAKPEVVPDEKKSERILDEQNSNTIPYEQNSESILDYMTVHEEDKRDNHGHNSLENISTVSNVNTDIDMEFNVNETEKSEKGRNDLDIKMSELEERTMKKFKGSLLDSIF